MVKKIKDTPFAKFMRTPKEKRLELYAKVKAIGPRLSTKKAKSRGQ